MSRGPGRVERAIETILDAEPDNAFTTDDLCDRVYGCHIEKKHRVAIIRAAKNIAQRRRNFDTLRSDLLGGTYVFFTLDNVMSYAMARLKASFIEGYRNRDSRSWRKSTEDDLLAKLGQGGKDRHLIEPGGTWWRHVAMWKAKLAGNDELHQKLQAEQKADMARVMAGR